jgi:hypothetical protein
LEITLPEYRDWSLAAVGLLQGVVYLDEAKVWNALCSHRSKLEEYFARIGLALVVDEAEGFAYLRQLEEDELERGYEALPKLFRKSRLTYEATLLCVLLRDELRRFEEEQIDYQRCVVKSSDLLELWKPFFPAALDDVKLMRTLKGALGALEDLKFVRLFSKDPEEWEIRRILKARVPVAKLEELLEQLRQASQAKSNTEE